jgi:T5SS/PEP-CTERM-associated repeat protein
MRHLKPACPVRSSRSENRSLALVGQWNLFGVVCGLILALVTSPALADDLQWDNAAGGNWSLMGNWNPAQIPTAADNVFFDLGGSYQVVWNLSPKANNVSIVDDVTFLAGPLVSSGVAKIDDPLAADLASGAIATFNGAQWDNANDAKVGGAGFGTLEVDNGGQFTSRSLYVGDVMGSTGEVTVDGSGSILTADGVGAQFGFFIGNAGTGTINVTGGGVARTTDTTGISDWELGETADGDGTLNINGAGSTAFGEDVIIGNFGSGHVHITGGGVFNQNIGSSPDAFVAQQVGSSGDVTVSGDGSQWLMGRLEIANLGDATLSVEAGGLVRSNSNDMALGDAGGSGRVAVFGAGASNSTLHVTNDLYVGSAGRGELSVGQNLSGTPDGNGSLVVGSDLFIGNNAGNNLDNKVVVSGADASANVGNVLYAGVSGTGTFEAHSGATITVAGALASGAGPGGDGTILIDGSGTTVAAANLFVGNTNGGASSTGIVTVSNQAVVTLSSATDGVVTLGDDPNSHGLLIITGAGSRVESTGGTAQWWIGGSGNDTGGDGILDVLNGGTAITTGQAILGVAGSATGTLLVDGQGSLFDVNGDFLHVGNSALGTAEVTGGGRVEANSLNVANGNSSGDSQLNVSGTDGINASTVDVAQTLFVGRFARGVLRIQNGGLVEASTSGNFNLQIGVEDSSDGSRVLVDGSGSRLDHQGTGRLSVGVNGGSLAAPSVLEVDNGGQVSTNQFYVADSAPSHAAVLVNGTGSRVDADSEVVIGDQGVGQADIEAGGVIESQGNVRIGGIQSGVGIANVSGAGSQLIAATTLSVAANDTGAGFATGTLNITDGGTVSNTGNGFIAQEGQNVGTVNVGGPGDVATWNNGASLFVGGSDTASGGTGTLNVNAGGTVDVTSTLSLWYKGTVNLNGGTIKANELLLADPLVAPFPTFNWTSGTFRFKANGNLNMETLHDLLGDAPTLVAGQELQIANIATLSVPLRLNGGTFSVGSISAASLANLDFDAGTLNLTNANLTVGSGGIFGATLVIDPGQSINVTNQATVDAGANLVVAGGFSSGGLTNNGDVVAIDTTIGGPVVNNSNLTVVGTVDFNGFVSGPGNFFGPGTANFNGGIAPGASPADVSFEGNIALAPANTLFIDLGGRTAGSQYDQLLVAGQASLGGTLDVTLINNFMPALNDQFDIITFASHTGGFAAYSGLDVGGHLALKPSLTATSFLLTARPAIDGDINLDGAVNIFDINSVSANWNTAGPAGDANGDGIVNIFDINLISANWGATGGGGLTAVPEPTSLVLLVTAIGSVLLAPFRRKKQRTC